MILYGYYRSSAAYRVRIALNLKKIAYENQFVHLLRNGGEQFSAAYAQLNPQKLIPSLVINNTVLRQSLAIIEYLEECYPTPALLPQTALDRAHVRAIAQMIACDIHPLGNLRVFKYLTGPLQQSEDEKLSWYRHWVGEGLLALETLLANHANTGRCCYGDTPTMADICLIPQMFGAKRFECPLDAYPTLQRIYDYCLSLPEFINACPEKQPDSV